MDYSPPGSSVLGDSPGKNTGVGCHIPLQGIFSTQGSNPGLPHCRRILYWLSHQGSPYLDLSPPRRGPTPDTFDPANFWQAISWHLAALKNWAIFCLFPIFSGLFTLKIKTPFLNECDHWGKKLALFFPDQQSKWELNYHVWIECDSEYTSMKIWPWASQSRGFWDTCMVALS